MAGRKPPLLPAKLRLPDLRADTVERRRLLQSVLDSPEAGLVLFQAPAGFGKTTVMAQLAHRLRAAGGAVGWLTLDERDADVTSFLAYLEAVVRATLQCAPTTARGEEDVADGDRETLVSRLVDMLLDTDREVTIFLDDFDAAAGPEVEGFMQRLLKYLPPGRRIVLGARAIPNIGLVRLQLDGRALVIGADELRFRLVETHAFFRPRFHLEDEDILQLLDRTDGWPAALQFVSLSFAKRSDRRSYSRSFSSLTPELSDYLAADVFLHQSADTRDFLLKTSILRSFNGNLCNRVTGRVDSAEVLERLERAGLFLQKDDQSPPWFRYHSLFRQFLEREFRRQLPEMVPVCHHRAAEWLRCEGRAEDAVIHLAAAGDDERLADEIEAHIFRLILEERLGTAIRWVELLPAATIESRPAIQGPSVIAYAFRRRFPEARAMLALRTGSSHEDRIARLNQELFLLAAEDRIDELGEVARKALSVVPPDRVFEHGINLNAYAYWLYASNRFDEAHECLIRAQAAHDAAGDLFGRVYQEGIDGAIALADGRLQLALRRLSAGLRHAEDHLPPGSSGGAFIAAHLGEVLYELNDTGRAAKLLEDYLPLIEQNCIVDAVVVAYVTLARIALAENRPEQTAGYVEHLIRLGYRHGLPRMVSDATWELIRTATLTGALDRADSLISEVSARQPVTSGEAQLTLHSSDLEPQGVGLIRYLVARGDLSGARLHLKRSMSEAARTRRHRRLLKLRLLSAVACLAGNDKTAALREMLQVLRQASEEGYIRMLVDEGPMVMRLVRLAYEEVRADANAAVGDPLGSYIQKVLSAGGEPAALVEQVPPGAMDSPLEPLTAKERDILGLLSAGKSNKALARHLGVTDNTIKWHLRNVYEKLGVNNRTQAVTAARRFGLLR